MKQSKSLSPARAFIRAREQLLRWRDDPEAAQRNFRWPALETFNWATDYFDPLARGNEAPALQTISGKIRRSELRRLEEARSPDASRRPYEFWEGDRSGQRS